MYGAIGAIRTAHAIETQKHLQWSPEGMDSTKTPRTSALFSKNDSKFCHSNAFICEKARSVLCLNEQLPYLIISQPLGQP